MRAFTYFILSFVGAAHGLPILLAEHKRDQLINLSPNLDLGLNASNDNSCLGLGISVCDPITVDSEKNSTVVHDDGSKAKTKEEPSTNDSGSGDSLINLSPDVDLGLDLSNENSCLGIGISACDPITVGSDVTNTVKDGGDEAKVVEPSSAASTTTTTPAPATYPVQPIPTSSTSPTSSPATNGGGNSLLDLSPKIAPDLNLSNDNSCQGIGISACDPITVDSIVKNISS
ncbi:hypothetical protein F4813DRAFT_118301 [Daldinia decipiens]|uniref:uncharacterized protein n=1 Tax=Daldinia decipiens TaxID=326647 RepID=UPI0020C2CF32|nr:uncharacterized protein F4813DRAFT_118301 [Daldinia decipiens]KAI1656972.1 hypothetical protein F4813DRAFT_118301 [Daldinia decipiens]